MKKLFIILCLILTVATVKIFAVPANPYPFEYVLPDGTTITITLRGDENINWAMSEDGYTLLRNENGFYEYAKLAENNALVPSGIIAKNIDQRSVEETIFLEGISKDLRYSPEQAHYMLQIRDMRINMQKFLGQKDASSNMISTGEILFPIVLVEFQDKPFTLSKSQFEALLNQPNYIEGNATGSIFDYFYAASYGQLNFQVDVFGPYTLSSPIGAYDPFCAGGDPRNMTIEAAIAAYNDGCNFELYDMNNDGFVDGIHIIFAGYGQESGACTCQSIWSHAWATTPEPEDAPIIGGKHIWRYSCSPELRELFGTDITYIGVIAHELSHVFGLPDMYDTDSNGSGGVSVDLGEWCLMAAGSWNDRGRTPPFHSAWCRYELGWIEAIIPATGQYTIPNPELSGLFYRINTPTDNEYFLLENRQKIGWEAFVHSSGMLIYHVDLNNPGWDENCINCNPLRRGLYIKQAGCGAASNCNGNRDRDTYPYDSNNSFADFTIPNSQSWSGEYTGNFVYNITHNTDDRTITFDFIDNDYECVPINSFPFNENFENFETNTPLCWTQENVTGKHYWEIKSEAAHTGSYGANLYFPSYTSQKTKLIMPEINLTEVINPTLKFFHKQEAWSVDQDILRIFYKTEATGTWNLLIEYKNNVPNWSERTITLPDISANYYIAFEGETRYGYGIQIDDISIESLDVSISDKQLEDIVLFPNPFKDEFFINEISTIKRITILNISGQIVITPDIKEYSISMRDFPAGVYFVIVETKRDKTIAYKMIKK